MKTYFDTAVRENRYYSEDWTFCENWRDLGGHIYVDRRVLLRHVGTYVFDGNTQQQLYKDLAAMFAPQPAAPAIEVAPLQTMPASEPEVMASSEDSPAPETE